MRMYLTSAKSNRNLSAANLNRLQKEAEADDSPTMCNGQSFHFEVSASNLAESLGLTTDHDFNRAAAIHNLYTLRSALPRNQAKPTPHVTDYNSPA